jgi:molecular chaperone DnaJ
VAQLDFYVILGVERSATVSQVKQAYKRLARRYHPDINPGDRESEAFFRLVTRAYETLCDPGRRQDYDVNGIPASSRPASTVEFQGFDFSSAGSDASVSFDELFSDVFQKAAELRNPAPGEPEQGSDLYGEVSFLFEEAIAGGERRLTVNRLELCEACSGSGRRRSTELRCSRCQGAGSTRWRRGHMVFSKSCAFCGGTGLLTTRPCSACGESGIVTLQEDITIQIPPGVSDGSRLRIESKGNAGRLGGRPGDLYITVKVSPHRFLRREGNNLFLTLPVAIHEAALGVELDVPTLEGDVKLRIPPGTQSGQYFKIKSRGVPSLQSGARGDLVIEVNVVTPPVTDDRSKELLKEFGRIHSNDVRKALFEE